MIEFTEYIRIKNTKETSAKFWKDLKVGDIVKITLSTDDKSAQFYLFCMTNKKVTPYQNSYTQMQNNINGFEYTQFHSKPINGI